VSTDGRQWKLWREQVVAVLRLEWKKSFLPRRGPWIYLLALAPVLIFAIRSVYLATLSQRSQAVLGAYDGRLFADIFQFFFLRLVVFFGCAGIFMNLFRGEMLNKSLHYYFLSPVRREVLLGAKYLAGVLSSAIIFCASVILQAVALDAHSSSGPLGRYFFQAQGLATLAAYLGVTLAACIAYGGVFLAIGVVFRNGLVPAACFLGWEMINTLLPPTLQKLSVIYYLKPLCPVQPNSVSLRHNSLLGLLSLKISTPPVFVCLLALSTLTIGLLILASWRIREMEIDYGTE
jgi:ABC-type transport system involved in multi-copper enzyme maturation permease subunit